MPPFGRPDRGARPSDTAVGFVVTPPVELSKAMLTKQTLLLTVYWTKHGLPEKIKTEAVGYLPNDIKAVIARFDTHQRKKPSTTAS